MVEEEVKMRAKTRKPLLPLSQAARGLGESCWSPGTRSATLRDFCRRRKGHRLSISGEAELYYFRSKVQRVVKGHNRDRGTITKGQRDTNSGCRACRRTGDDISRRGREGRKKNHDTHEA